MMGVGRRIMRNHLRRLSAYDIINCIEWYLSYADDHLLIMLDRLAGSTPHSAHLRIGTVMGVGRRIMTNHLRLLSPDESSEAA